MHQATGFYGVFPIFQAHNQKKFEGFKYQGFH